MLPEEYRLIPAPGKILVREVKEEQQSPIICDDEDDKTISLGHILEIGKDPVRKRKADGDETIPIPLLSGDLVYFYKHKDFVLEVKEMEETLYIMNPDVVLARVVQGSRQDNPPPQFKRIADHTETLR